MTEMPTTLNEALLALQSNLPEVVKGETARVETQKGGYVYSYAGLSAVTAVVLPRLAALGMIWVCRPGVNAEGRPVLRYSLRHVPSGEAIEDEYLMPLPPNATPQMVGSMISYSRRYALLAVTGIAPAGDDDDASAASGRSTTTRTRRASTRDSASADVKADTAGQNGARMISDPQSKKLHTLLNKAGHVERDQKLAFCRSIIGREDLESSKGLTFREAALVLSSLEQALNENTEEDPA